MRDVHPKPIMVVVLINILIRVCLQIVLWSLMVDLMQ
jgi:hypothetical protein